MAFYETKGIEKKEAMKLVAKDRGTTKREIYHSGRKTSFQKKPLGRRWYLMSSFARSETANLVPLRLERSESLSFYSKRIV